MAQTTSRPLSSSTNSICKSVQFSRFIKISFTYPEDEYDRTALEPAKLTFSEASELMQLRINWKQEMKKRLEERSSADANDSEDGCVPEASSNSSGASGSRSRHHTTVYDRDADQDHDSHHSILQPAYPLMTSSGLPSVHSAPASSLSLQDVYGLGSHVNGSNSSLCSSCSCHGDCHHYIDDLPHKKTISGRTGSASMMHRHSQLHRSKDDVQCLA
ncbi:hypothetical protein MVEG_02730 [Podila verticillata NRRL 6337]|nr:hypothetical protein MVEG_02730 [Podila verticillata NRRL 6337]